MAKFAELPDGNLVEFPDNWTEIQMDEAVQRDFGHLLSGATQPSEPPANTKLSAVVPSYMPQGIVDLLQAPAKYVDKFTQNVSPTQAWDTVKATGDEFAPWFASLPGRAIDMGLSLQLANEQKRSALRAAGEKGIFPNSDNPDFGFQLDADAIANDPRVKEARATIDFTDQERANVRQAATGDNTYLQDLFDTVTSAAHLVPSLAVAPASPGASLAMMSAGKGVEEFRPRTKAGEAPGAAALGSLFKSATELTEKVPLGVLLDPAMPFAKKLVASMVAEYGQEFATSVMDSAYDMATIKPDMTWEQLLAQANKEGWMGAVTGPVVATAMQPVVKAQEAYQNSREDTANNKALQAAAEAQAVASLRPDPKAVDPRRTVQRPDQVGPPAATALNAEVPLPAKYTEDLPAMLRPQEDGLRLPEDVPPRTDVPPFLKPQWPMEPAAEVPLPAKYTADLPASLRPDEDGMSVDIADTGIPTTLQSQAPGPAVLDAVQRQQAEPPPDRMVTLDAKPVKDIAVLEGSGKPVEQSTSESGGAVPESFKELSRQSEEKQKLIDARHDELDAKGVSWDDQQSDSTLTKLYEDRIAVDTRAAQKGFDGAKNIIEKRLHGSVDNVDSFKWVLESVYGLYDKPTTGVYMMSSRTGKALDDPASRVKLERKIAESLLEKERPGVDFDTAMDSPMSGLSRVYRNDLLARAKASAIGIEQDLRDFFTGDQPTLDRATMLEKNGKPVSPISENNADVDGLAAITMPARKTPVTKDNIRAVLASKVMVINTKILNNIADLSRKFGKETRIPTLAQSRIIEKSLGALVANGLPVNAVSAFTAGVVIANVRLTRLGAHVRATQTAGDRSMIYVSRMAVNAASDTTTNLDFILAHELGHAVDFNGDFEKLDYGDKRTSLAKASGLFDPSGAVHDELVHAWTDDTLGLRDALNYPVELRLDSGNPKDFVAREMFAQAFAVYYTRGRLSPAVMQSALPKTYALMEAVHNALAKNTTGTFGSIGQAVRRAFQDVGFTASQSRVQPDVVTGSDTDSVTDGATQPPVDGGLPRVPEAPPRGPGGSGRGDVTPAADQSINFTVPDETLRDAFVRTFQDKLHRVYIAQNAIKEFAQSEGRDLDIHADVWAAEETISGRVELDLRELEEDHLSPLITAMRDMGVSQEVLDRYLVARHAEERNKVIAARRTDLPDGGSGMMTQEANDTIAEIEQQHAGIEQLAQRVWNILARKRQLLTETSLLAQDDADAWDAQYKHYVPLKGMAADAMLPGKSFSPRGLSTKGREARAAAGRTTMAASPLTNTVHDMTMAIIRARRNYVGQALMRLVQQNPNQDYWQVFSPTQPDYTMSVVDGTAQRTPIDMRHNNDYFGVKFEGKQFYIKLKDQAFKQAMLDLGVEKQNVMVRSMNQVTRYIATINTAYDLAFGPTNFIRDLQTAVYGMLAEQDLHDGRVTTTDLTWTFTKTLVPAFRSINRALHRKAPREGNVLDQHGKDFLEDGAKAGYYNTLDIAGQQRRIERMIADANGGLMARTRQGLRAVDDVVADYNATIENSTRLAAYSAARTIMETAGVPSVTARKKAAHLAKNLTVNFSRRGEASSVFNGLYAFFNVTFQGGAQFTRTVLTLKRDPVTGRKSLNAAQKVALAATGWAAVQSMLNELMSGEDDDGRSYYGKIPAHVRERNMIFMMPDGENYKTLPLAYGYNMFHLAGTTAADVSQGLYTAEEGGWLFTRAILGSFSPLGAPSSDGKEPSADIVKMLSPSLILPIAEIGFNSNFFGSHIWRDDKYNDRTPESSNNINAPESLVRMSQWLNEVTGGSMYEKGRIDIAADKLQHWFEFATGGPGRMVNQVSRLNEAINSDEPVPASAVPFLYRFNKEPQKNRAQEYYYENRAVILSKMDAIRDLRGADRTEYREQNSEFLNLIRAVKAADGRLSGLRKRKEMELAKTDDPAKQAKIKRKYSAEMEAEYNVVNRLWVKQIEKAE
jgi:hypothetical protein